MSNFFTKIVIQIFDNTDGMIRDVTKHSTDRKFENWKKNKQKLQISDVGLTNVELHTNQSQNVQKIVEIILEVNK